MPLNSIKKGAGSIVIWGCSAASGPGQLATIKGKMNSQFYQGILQGDVRVAVHQLKLSRSQVTQQDSDPKHQSKSMTE